MQINIYTWRFYYTLQNGLQIFPPEQIYTLFSKWQNNNSSLNNYIIPLPLFVKNEPISKQFSLMLNIKTPWHLILESLTKWQFPITLIIQDKIKMWHIRNISSIWCKHYRFSIGRINFMQSNFDEIYKIIHHILKLSIL